MHCDRRRPDRYDPRPRGAVAKLAKAPVSKTGDSRFESWLPRRSTSSFGRRSNDRRLRFSRLTRPKASTHVPTRFGSALAALLVLIALAVLLAADARAGAQCKGGDSRRGGSVDKRAARRPSLCLINKERHEPWASGRCSARASRREPPKPHGHDGPQALLLAPVPGRGGPRRAASPRPATCPAAAAGASARTSPTAPAAQGSPRGHRRLLDEQLRASGEHPQRQPTSTSASRGVRARRRPATRDSAPPTRPTSVTSADSRYGGRVPAPSGPPSPSVSSRHPDGRDLGDRARDGAARHGRAAPARDRAPDRCRGRGTRPRPRCLRDPDPAHLDPGRSARRPDRPPAAAARRARPDRRRLDPDRRSRARSRRCSSAAPSRASARR